MILVILLINIIGLLATAFSYLTLPDTYLILIGFSVAFSVLVG
jgi:hypothetical protein